VAAERSTFINPNTKLARTQTVTLFSKFMKINNYTRAESFLTNSHIEFFFHETHCQRAYSVDLFHHNKAAPLTSLESTYYAYRHKARKHDQLFYQD
jgi:hypothetical protein